MYLIRPYAISCDTCEATAEVTGREIPDHWCELPIGKHLCPKCLEAAYNEHLKVRAPKKKQPPRLDGHNA